MLKPDNDLRLACAAATLFVTLGLCWLFEVFLGTSANSVVGACCAGWRAVQYLPHSLAVYATDPSEALSLPIFWLLFTLQWFLVGSSLVSRIVSYFGHLAFLLHEEPAPLPERAAIITC